MTSMGDWANVYAGQGIAVFPLHSIYFGRCTCSKKQDCSSPGKHPRWEPETLEAGVSDATTDLDLIKRWWHKWPTANIGLATGPKSKLLVIDIDGEEGYQSLKQLQRRCGKLPKTATAKTGKGEHIFFRCTDSIRNRAGWHPGIDVRGDGGYVVAAPSMHVSGKRYTWANQGKIETAPLMLRQLLKAKVIPTPHTLSDYDRPKPHKPVSEMPILGEGKRNDGVLRAGARWVWEDKPWGEVESLVVEMNATRCQPPLRDSEVRCLLRSLQRFQR
jgi:putative DNA primase/helicase